MDPRLELADSEHYVADNAVVSLSDNRYRLRVREVLQKVLLGPGMRKRIQFDSQDFPQVVVQHHAKHSRDSTVVSIATMVPSTRRPSLF